MYGIVVASVLIVAVTPKLLHLYTEITGDGPSSSVPLKLEPHTHRPLPLVSSTYYPDPSTASAHKLLQIGLPSSTSSSVGISDVKRALRIRSVYIKEPSLVIERAYTPLYDTLPGSHSAALVGTATAKEPRVLDLIVKRYPDGELGKMLHRAVANPTMPQLEVRGPVDTWSFERDSAETGGVPERIVMVVGGTGITPAYQLLTNLFGRPGKTAQARMKGAPRIEVLYATQDLENVLLLPQLHASVEANRDKVSVQLFAERVASPSSLSPGARSALGKGLVVSPSAKAGGRSWIPFFSSKASSLEPKLELTSVSSPTTTIPVFESRITQQHLEKVLTPTADGRTLILVSGPDGMVSAMAGPRSRDGQTQGRLTGILASLNCRHEDVFKL
uniref:FAD-binding FR-type domain-containing protein n=2 Tax=Kalmanozyma brasiliensis (strain GHG001) TaxID=1365824 RepID=V5E8J1_KALBG